MKPYSTGDQRADTAFLVGAAYARDIAVGALPDVLDAHRPGEDWCCVCGEDLFGGSAAYSWQLYLAHAADALRVKLGSA